MWARVISALIGAFMLYSALGWILDPTSAAAGLAMTLVTGPGETTLGMNTQIGDFTSFFFTAGIMACIGAYRNEHIWLYGTISLLGSAAVFRTYAGLVHGADFLTTAIVFEVVMALLLLLSVYKMKTDS
ncbi:MAG: hypothetical protein QF527_02070 [SAR86 cluster bacterium]|jgi:hypothetical protein|nr:hypothetical protein [SAR86 cluster bacterium]